MKSSLYGRSGSKRRSRSRSHRRSRSRHEERRSGASSFSSSSTPSGWKSEKKKQYRFDSPPRTGETPEEQQKKLIQQQISASPAVAGTSLLPTVAPSAAFSGPASSLALDAAATKAARELYVGNLPPSLEVPQLMEFLNAAMAAVGGALLPGPPAVKAWRSTDGHYAFVEFRTMEEASNGMQLNGLNCMGFNLRIGRPKTYPQDMNHLIPPPTIPLLHPQAAMGAGIVGGALPGVGLGAVPGAAGLPGAVAGVPGAQTTGAGGVGTLGGAAAAGTPGTSVATVASNPQAALAAAQLAAHGVTSSQTKEDKNQQPERLCILDLPPLMSEEKVRQLVETFGPVNAFHLLKKDDGSEMVCIVEYVDLESQEQAMDILHSNSPYRILLAEEAIQQEVIAPFFKKAKAKQMKAEDEEEEEMDGEEMSIQALLRPQVCTRVLLLSNIVDVEDLLDDKEYEEIVEDIRLECEECGGPVLSVNIPRPVRGFEHESQPEYQQKERETAAHAKKEEGDSEVKTEDAGTAMVKQEVTENAADGENEGVEKAKEAEVKDEAAGGKRSDGNEQKPATIGFAYVEFEDCEWSAKARKVSGHKD
ncbi:putative U2 small nuclear ribonucleoprotein auxiliary factor U2AF [Neospora caninum Liverpool]|uniref:Putative U2 small nuclear ribonucleoprotein auxiliary factor U2AF n=1 Tax=Neospora caninum (strain Liverpool) TaxID=572307 RepID=F0VMG5_NEOCL|nr:putative U2 small nuclear ribonucleoprotein auxiliary factor U2AF [Neospora caninum Liverpool]CBZ54911.1 putative U2 small nuclear ribonucleoprotein auxiliary factor U2AF [Neospora caninum Liverpool]|eukprot:XP_003884939.1 putative U2 small nuclear ribonucleoprotein auxiliary factor U2AF [Neospora caninum Liverpool]